MVPERVLSAEAAKILRDLPIPSPFELFVSKVTNSTAAGKTDSLELKIPCQSDFCVVVENPDSETASTLPHCIGCKHTFSVIFRADQKKLPPIPCPRRDGVTVVVLLDGVRDSLTRNPYLDPEIKKLLTSREQRANTFELL